MTGKSVPAASENGCDGAYDCYGGAMSVRGDGGECFSLQNKAGRWWLMTPAGHGLVSMGVVHCMQGMEQPACRMRHDDDDRKYAAHVTGDLQQWGFNCVGYGGTHKQNIVLGERLPFLVSMEVLFTSRWRHEDFRHDDVFDPAWKQKAAAEIAEFCNPVKDNKRLIGYCTTDTPWWRVDRSCHGPGNPTWLDFYRGLPADTSGKKQYVAFLVDRLGSVREVAARYNVAAGTVGDLEKTTDWGFNPSDAGIRADDEAFLGRIATEYYRFCNDTIRKIDPGHLYFGDRYFIDTASDLPEPVLQAALQYVDAIAVQPAEGPFDRALFDGVHAVAGKPILICDYAVTFPTEEHPKVMWDTGAKTESEAADQYEAFLDAAFSTPYILGVHRCTYIDLPRPGVLKQGLVRQDGTPYETTVRRYAEIHRRLYEEMYDVSKTGSQI